MPPDHDVPLPRTAARATLAEDTNRQGSYLWSRAGTRTHFVPVEVFPEPWPQQDPPPHLRVEPSSRIQLREIELPTS